MGEQIKPATFAVEKKLGLGFLAAVLLSLLVGVVATYGLDWVATSKDRVANIESGDLLDAEKMGTALEREVTFTRDYVLTGREASIAGMNEADAELLERIQSFKDRGLDPGEQVLIADIERADREHDAARDRLIELRKSGKPQTEILHDLDTHVTPELAQFRTAVAALEDYVIVRVDSARRESNHAALQAARYVRLAVMIDVLLAGGLGLLFTRTVGQLRRAHQERLALWAREREARAQAELARQALAESVAKLEQSNRDLDAFTGRIAHDLRNLLSPLALAPARLRKARAEETRESVADSIERSIARAEGMIEGLLSFSRSAQAIDPTKWASVSETVAEVRNDLASLAAEVGATIETDVENVDVACSRELLHVVLMNLLHNALKFLEGRELRRVCIRVRRAGADIEISLEDTGPGIPPDERARIFDPFYRVPGVTAHGTGIGLSTVQRIVTAYRGRIVVESELGKGTTFRVRLPRRATIDTPENPVLPP